ncbi:unnamed protein product [Effrenium voratum]|nr:unnamed protein product [Effrenium voratum]
MKEGARLLFLAVLLPELGQSLESAEQSSSNESTKYHSKLANPFGDVTQKQDPWTTGETGKFETVAELQLKNVERQGNLTVDELDTAEELDNATEELDNATEELDNATEERDNATEELNNAAEEASLTFDEVEHGTQELGYEELGSEKLRSLLLDRRRRASGISAGISSRRRAPTFTRRRALTSPRRRAITFPRRRALTSPRRRAPSFPRRREPASPRRRVLVSPRRRALQPRRRALQPRRRALQPRRRATDPIRRRVTDVHRRRRSRRRSIPPIPSRRREADVCYKWVTCNNGYYYGIPCGRDNRYCLQWR